MTAEPALNLVETEPVEEKALTIVDQAKAVKVTDSASYTAAGIMWKSLGDMIKEVKDTFDPIVQAAHLAHKAATEKRAKFLDPLTAAQKSVKALMSSYDAEQERIRLEAQRKAEEEARQLAEEQALLEAIAAEEEAKANGATKEEAAQVAEQVVAQPVYVAPVVVPKTVPKMQGGPVYRELWAAQVVSIKELCRAIGAGQVSEETVIGLDRKEGIVTSPALNKLATALKGTMNVPGCKPYSRRV